MSANKEPHKLVGSLYNEFAYERRQVSLEGPFGGLFCGLREFMKNNHAEDLSRGWGHKIGDLEVYWLETSRSEVVRVVDPRHPVGTVMEFEHDWNCPETVEMLYRYRGQATGSEDTMKHAVVRQLIEGLKIC